MGCFIRYRSLLLGLLLCLITLCNSIADANNVRGKIEKNNPVMGDKKGLDENDTSRADQRISQMSSKWLRGRKLGAHQGVKMADEEEKEQMVQVKGTVETGKVNTSSKKSMNTSSKDSRKTKSRRTTHSRLSTGSKMNAKQPSPSYKKGAANTLHHESDDHDDEVQKMLNMLSKDYHFKGSRRSPINNNIPVDDVNGRQP